MSRKLTFFVAVLLLLALVMGYAIGRTSRSGSEPTFTAENPDSPSDYKTKYDSLKGKLEQLGQVDIQEYLDLKDKKAKYEKANEILGQVLLILLYDLGLKTTGPQIEKLKEQASTSTRAREDSPEDHGDVAPVNKEAQPAPVAVDSSRLAQISTEAEAQEFLKKVQHENLFDFLRTGQTLKNRQLEQLNGTFVGQVIFDNPERSPWQVEMHIQARVVEGKYRGRHQILISRDGKQIGNTRGDLSTDLYMGFEGDPAAIVINAHDGDGYFQLYYFDRLSEFQGLVYMKKSIGHFVREGTVRLAKR